MARLIVKGTWRAEAEITVDPETGKAEAICKGCPWTGTDRGHLEDTLNVAEVHVDNECPGRTLSWAGSEEAP